MDESKRESITAARQGILRWLCKRATETGNPLLFFVAFQSALEDALFDIVNQSLDAGASRAELEAALSGADRCIQIPAELHEFFLMATIRLNELEEGRDFRDCPGPLPPNLSSDAPEWRDYRERKEYGGKRLAAETAARLVTQAFGITRPGFNAFKLSERDDRAERAWHLESEARKRGLTPLEARYEAMTHLGYSDERTFRRLKSRKRRNRAKPHP